MPDPDIYAYLAQASLAGPRAFTRAVLETLRSRFHLVAASAYINSPATETVRLRHQVGFEYKHYTHFDVPLGSFVGEAITKRKAIVSRDLRTDRRFRNKGVLDVVQLDAMIVVPLMHGNQAAEEAARRVGAPNPIGVLCLYPHRIDDIEVVTALAQQYAPFIARMYIGSLDRAAMDLRQKMVERVVYRKEFGSLAHNYLRLAREELSVEAAALWVLDVRRNQLYRRKALEPRKPEKQGAMAFVRVDDPRSMIAECFRTTQLHIHDKHNCIVTDDDVDLACSAKLVNWVAMPVRLPEDAKLRGRTLSAAGVLELANHVTIFDSARHITSPNWEDIYLAEFACEVLSVLTYQVLRTKDHESDYERLFHGAKTSIVGARSHLQALDELVEPRTLPKKVRHFIPNAIEWLEDFEAQLSRDDLVHQSALEVEDVALYGQVLAKLEPMVERMNTRDDDRPLVLSGVDVLGLSYLRIPKIRGNRQALDCVFRNLLDNSRKYCRPAYGEDRIAKIEIVASAGEGLVLTFMDNGEPIPEDEALLIFEDGYRGATAQGVQPQGVGSGLYTCRELMQKMGGTIEYVIGARGVTFRLELETSKGRDRR